MCVVGRLPLPADPGPLEGRSSGDGYTSLVLVLALRVWWSALLHWDSVTLAVLSVCPVSALAPAVQWSDAPDLGLDCAVECDFRFLIGGGAWLPPRGAPSLRVLCLSAGDRCVFTAPCLARAAR